MDHNPTWRVIKILEVISNNPEGYTLSELAKLTEIPFSTLSPIVKTLLHHKFLELKYETSTYTIGIQSYFIGSSFISRNSALELIRKEMDSLANESGETCQLGILENDQVFYLLKVEGQASIRVVSEVGGSMPAHTTALGKAILAFMEKDKVANLYENKDLVKITDKTITDKDVLLEQIQQIQKSEFAYEHGENTENLACIAIPIFQDNVIVAAISVAYPLFRETKEKMQQIEELLVKYKNNIEKVLLTYNLF